MPAPPTSTGTPLTVERELMVRNSVANSALEVNTRPVLSNRERIDPGVSITRGFLGAGDQGKDDDTAVDVASNTRKK